MTKTWSAKLIKEKKDTDIYRKMNRTLECILKKGSLPYPMPELPKNIAPVEKRRKEDVIRRQKSRFNIL